MSCACQAELIGRNKQNGAFAKQWCRSQQTRKRLANLCYCLAHLRAVQQSSFGTLCILCAIRECTVELDQKRLMKHKLIVSLVHQCVWMGEQGHCDALWVTVMVLEKHYISELNLLQTQRDWVCWVTIIVKYWYWQFSLRWDDVFCILCILSASTVLTENIWPTMKLQFTFQYIPSFILLSLPLHSHRHADLDSSVISMKDTPKEIKPFSWRNCSEMSKAQFLQDGG